MDIPAQVALFPLPDHVLLPGLPASFRIFEPRYRALVADLAAADPERRWLAMPRLAPGWQAGYGGSPAYLPVAALALVRDIRPLAGGESLIIVEGLVRLRLGDAPSPHPYRLARAAALPDAPDDSDRAQLAAGVADLAGQARALLPPGGGAGQWLERLAGGEDPLAGLAVLGAALVAGADQRQAFLECLQPAARLEMVRALLARAQRERGGWGPRPSAN
jgi:Lon protease-like protein